MNGTDVPPVAKGFDTISPHGRRIAQDIAAARRQALHRGSNRTISRLNNLAQQAERFLKQGNVVLAEQVAHEAARLVRPQQLEAPRREPAAQAEPRARTPEERPHGASVYRDVSSDPTVSFQMPTSIAHSRSFGQVAAHEAQHVRHELARARMQGDEVNWIRVYLYRGVDPRTGEPYAKGGQAVIRTSAKEEFPPRRYARHALPERSRSLVDILA